MMHGALCSKDSMDHIIPFHKSALSSLRLHMLYHLSEATWDSSRAQSH